MRSNITFEDICQKLKPVFGEKIDRLHLKYRMAQSRDEKMEIEQAIDALYHKYLNSSFLSEKILLEPPKEHQVTGDFPLGIVSYADSELYPFSLREQDMVRHACITGMSGSGKTNLAFHILGNMILKDKKMIVFDWKNSFRSLMLMDDKLQCFTIGNNRISNLFKININEPPKGVSPKEWINTLCDLVSECFFTSHGVHKLLSEALDSAFKDFGVYAGSNNYPTWYQIKDRLEQKERENKKGHGRESEWLASALRIAHSMTFGDFGDAVNYKGPMKSKVDDLFEKRTIFELNSLNIHEKKFFCEYLLTYIYKHKKSSPYSITDKFEFAIIVDEAHNIFLKDKANFMKETVTEMIYREVREYGISLICLDQHISKLSDVVAGNSACNIAFQQTLPQDIEATSGMMQMRENKRYFSMLPVGHAIVRLVERFHQPFLIKVPLVGLKKKIVGDEIVAERMKNLVKTDRRMQVYTQMMNEENLRKKVAGLKNVYHAAGVSEVSDEFVKEQIDAQKFMQGAVDREEAKKEKEGKIPPRTVNHLQQELMDYIMKQMENGHSLDAIKRFLQGYGYNSTDLNAAIKIVKNRHPKFISKETALEMIKNGSVKPSKKSYENSYSQQTTNNTTQQTNSDRKQFLHKLFGNEYPTGKLYRELNLSGRKGNELKNELLEQGLIEIEEVRTSLGWTKKIRLSRLGREEMMRAGKPQIAAV